MRIPLDRDPQEHSIKLIVTGVVGVIAVVVLSVLMAGCGSVTMAMDDGGVAGAGGDGGSGGHVTVMADGGMAGATGGAGGMPPLCTPDSCNTCVDGKRVPLPDGRLACGACQAGKLVADPDGTSCGDPTCSGTQDVQGFPGGGRVWSASDTHVCKAGACSIETTVCSGIKCPTGCDVQYQGCTPSVSGACVCVNKGGSVCS